ncbi:hydroxymethylglutaryl-CoA reductase (NADPH) [Methanofollis fontis]|uniref:3-hydroxy-3-methylglutaryl coenzyme A reductase n=1 Tax=Methanofollis fontis TaxID=2052832 RepID=A0A483CV70_9EURY|nr:hydroxymethylglutaryl-CoA reductase (NADPH) [Methanofollis fontis]TAJ45381.1 hydroxymethylglutaryl-CoA reductase (NADPH) [Methanofollis fontis]
MEDPLARLKNGTLKLYALESEFPPVEAVRVRRNYVEAESGADLAALGSFSIGIDRVVKRNIENMIGAVQIPVGVAGPIRVNGAHASGTYWLPLATTEGALVASANRGASAITRAGGAEVRITGEGMTRAPIFAARDIVHAAEIVDWARTHHAECAAAAERTTSRGRLLSVTPYIVGTNVFLRCAYDTKDAMGMNMATIATAEIANLVERETGARLIALSGNMCTDKKPAAINMIEGRGRSVVAGIRLTNEQIASILKTDARSLVEVNTRKNLIGSARAGSLGFNAHAANIVAALYLACGQDPAHVVEGSTCITTVEETEDGAYIAVTLPAVQVGTVGGGTGIDTQAACLSLLGVAGGGTPEGANARAFAEIVGAAVLAGELSLLGALAANHLARAHQQLGRG